MKKLIKVTMTIIMMVLAINVSNAQQRPRSGQGNGQGFRNEQGSNLQGLNLTEDQQAKMKSMRLDLQKEMLQLRNELGENMAKMRTLRTADNADMKAINKLIDSNSVLRSNMAKLRASNHQEVRKILTEEQRIMFDSREFRRGRISHYQSQGYRHGKHGRQKRSATPRTER
jgi:Spy/CpxP family protein refolding chaperone